ncbi:MAG TPA: glycerate kinase [Deltaproteobacteria bacterium]|jgi:hydroxypyruvate reductase|nr:glycerate kinase [Deltaproteobacteria bacterium]HQI02027.1 glycerate kinase [Deltaproteobacteria bacterium]
MDPKSDLQSIFFKAIEKVDPYPMIGHAVRIEGELLAISHGDAVLSENLAGYRNITVLGIGKAAPRMAKALEEILGDRISEGAVITKYGYAEELERVRVIEAGHPVPDEKSVLGAEVLTGLAAQADEKTLIINLVSGGGSSLFSLPRQGITLADLQETTKILLESGADIREINCIRKHLSRVKGGQFARISNPARMITLILSDVVGDRLDAIASGITVPDTTTFSQALDIIRTYRIGSRLPSPVMHLLEAGSRGEVPETPKQGDPVFGRVVNIIIGNNAAACRAARDHAACLGYNAYFLTSSLTGESREIARFFTALAKDIGRGNSDFVRPCLIVAGGETTVTIRGKGIGGRNLEMALSFLADIMETADRMKGVYFLSAGTDGTDGPTDAAGALIGPDIIQIINRSGINPRQYLDNNDSYRFFEKTGSLFVTGPTGTNVCDIQLLALV